MKFLILAFVFFSAIAGCKSQKPKDKNTVDYSKAISSKPCSEDRYHEFYGMIGPLNIMGRHQEAQDYVKKIISSCELSKTQDLVVMFKIELLRSNYLIGKPNEAFSQLKELLSEVNLKNYKDNFLVASHIVALTLDVFDLSEQTKLCGFLKEHITSIGDEMKGSYLSSVVLGECSMAAGDFEQSIAQANLMKDSRGNKVEKQKSYSKYMLIAQAKKSMGDLKGSYSNLEKLDFISNDRNQGKFRPGWIAKEKAEIDILLGRKDRATKLLVKMKKSFESFRQTWYREKNLYYYSRSLMYLHVFNKDFAAAKTLATTIVKNLKSNPFWNNHKSHLPAIEEVLRLLSTANKEVDGKRLQSIAAPERYILEKAVERIISGEK